VGRPTINFLSDSEIEAIHDASLRVLEKTGIKVMSNEALEILKKAGAKVKGESGLVTIPRNLVKEALAMAPKTVKLCARNPKYDLELNKQKTHFCADGGPPFMLDIETGKRRYSTSEDIARCAIVADYLDHVDLIWPLGAGSDVPASMRYIVDMYTSLKNCQKHFQGDATTGKEAQYQIEIAATIAGGKEELRKRPIFSHVVCTLSPLSYDKGMTEASIELARAGIPVAIYPMPTIGGSSPATLAGAMVLNNAEFLGGLVIQELTSPGAPVIYAADVGSFDFKTGSGIISPESNLLTLGLNQVANYYHLPSEVEVSCTLSKTLDAQSGFEKAAGLIAHLMATPDIALGLGSLEGARMTSAEALVLDNEIVDYALKFIEGLEVNEETMAVDIIEKVGPGGTFLGQKHTVENFRERWMTRLSDISSFEAWEQQGSRSIGEAAREKVKEILATHEVTPLPENVEEEIRHILKKAEAELL
jgi:trimethylamine---corrinoid protein Co-methyltransferase